MESQSGRMSMAGSSSRSFPARSAACKTKSAPCPPKAPPCARRWPRGRRATSPWCGCRCSRPAAFDRYFTETIGRFYKENRTMWGKLAGDDDFSPALRRPGLLFRGNSDTIGLVFLFCASPEDGRKEELLVYQMIRMVRRRLRRDRCKLFAESSRLLPTMGPVQAKQTQLG